MVRCPSHRVIDRQNSCWRSSGDLAQAGPAIKLFARKEQNGRTHSCTASFRLRARSGSIQNRVREQRWSIVRSGGAQETPSHAADQNLRCGKEGQRGSPTSTRLRVCFALLAARAAKDTPSCLKAEPRPRLGGFNLPRSTKLGPRFSGAGSGEPALTPGILTNLKRAIGRDPSCRAHGNVRQACFLFLRS
ncbi:hypothetical protein GA0061099_102215 [Bradyrhizobium yuanmingense]|uniref:Uncharacterized protein n=1 Tax=Bradyrhizobium yuanmingense TaxID=108015 RepID=A0A1C3XHT3_9BRAD|nr:hypothetical protein IQ15_07205 [Bradyrhizobium yuanmingense]SCB51847.1 hypothetical protein GA0061099_102215 [Bradyrhizobium yuanmingense]